MKKIALIAGFALMSMALFIACGKQEEESINAPLLKEKIGIQTINLIKIAKTVEVEDIEPSKVKGYAFTGYGKALSQSKSTELKNLLLDDNSFEFDRMKSCLFIPKIAFHFKTNEQVSITILYSPWCKQIKILGNNQDAILEADAISDKIESLLSGFSGEKQ